MKIYLNLNLKLAAWQIPRVYLENSDCQLYFDYGLIYQDTVDAWKLGVMYEKCMKKSPSTKYLLDFPFQLALQHLQPRAHRVSN